MPIQINKKVRTVIEVNVEASQDEIKSLALNNEIVQAYLQEQDLASIQVMNDRIVVIQLKEKMNKIKR